MAGVFGNWDGAAELQKLQGIYSVKDYISGRSEWTVEGKKVTIVRGDKTINAELELAVPGQIKVVKKLAGGGLEKSVLSYARNDKDIYIGLGTAGSKVDDLYIVEEDGMVVYDGTTCTYYKESFGGRFEAPVTVTGSVEANVFSYQLPDRFKKGEMKDYSVEIVGSALLNDQAKGNIVKL